ncbi:MAG: LytTR family transcriptional regulator DNA-binding domain-containing protein [Lachnospiraceae bacterium]|nr:LytTR family transcriptional regulator DNA-binding domain-containing protein [Lachnospiraceae bacterium]
MHVAICDDNVADRKHIERLLSRESDKRAGTPNILYIDSYGEKMHFLANPLKYNLIFMDMSSEPGIVEFILEHLTEMGYQAPLILYSGKIDYTKIPNLPDYVVHAKKPYIPDPLPEFLALGDANVAGHVITIMVHTNHVINHVPKYSIMYALEEQNTCNLYLTNGSILEIDEDISELRQLLEHFEEFERVNQESIANFKYVTAIMPGKLVMQDSKELKIPFLSYREYKRLKHDIDERD